MILDWLMCIRKSAAPSPFLSQKKKIIKQKQQHTKLQQIEEKLF